MSNGASRGGEPGGDRSHGLIRAAVAPVLAEPRITATQISQYVLGHRVELLDTDGEWWRVRGGDGYRGWMHAGYVEVGTEPWARRWEVGDDAAESLVSLGARLRDEEERPLARLPWGARLFREAPEHFRLPDGRRGASVTGEVVAARRLEDRFPPRGASVVRSARRWTGTPYLWGGVTPAGADCSGFLQSVFRMHGVALPRDTPEQAEVGTSVDPGEDFAALQPADLLYFAERPGEVTHVVLSLGGARVLHSALSNGGVATNDLTGERAIERTLRERFVAARRMVGE